MATFKAVVQKHQRRDDDSYPISIRLTNNRKSVYISTGIYAKDSQIAKRSFELKDSGLIIKTNQIIGKYTTIIQMLSVEQLKNLSASELKQIINSSRSSKIDFIEEIVEFEKTKNFNNKISPIIKILKENGYDSLPIESFTSAFVDKFKEMMDKKDIVNSTKNVYLAYLGTTFKWIKHKYNTEFVTVVAHDPFYRVTYYPKQVSAKRNLSADKVREIFEYDKYSFIQQRTIDIMKISFCLCGVNIKDLYNMEKCRYDKNTFRLSYNRGKTKDKTFNHSLSELTVPAEIRELMEKYEGRGERLFNFDTLQKDYHSFLGSINEVSKRVAAIHGLPNLSSYYFRHSWATIARNECGVSTDDIDLALVHVSKNPMADVYINTDYSIIDKANRKVLDVVFGNKKKSSKSL